MKWIFVFGILIIFLVSKYEILKFYHERCKNIFVEVSKVSLIKEENWLFTGPIRVNSP